MYVGDAAWVHMVSRGWAGVLMTVDETLLFLYLHALHYGTSAFEGIRAYRDVAKRGKNIFRLPEHLTRLLRSCELYGLTPLPFTEAEFDRACRDVIAANPSHTYLRPIVFRGEGLGVDPTLSPVCGAVLSAPWGKYLKSGHHHDGVASGVSDWRRPEADQLPVAAKGSANYVVGQLIKQAALRRGLAELLLRAPDRSQVAEASGMNLFLVAADGRLVTPDTSASILMGITRATVIEIVPELFGSSGRVIERPVAIEELFTAREVFFTGTATEITPVTMIDGVEVGRDTSHVGFEGPVTRAIREYYGQIVTGEIPRYAHWLTFVPDQQPALIEQAF